MSVRDLVAIDRCLAGEVEDRLDAVGVQRSQVVVDELLGDRPTLLPADHTASLAGEVVRGEVQVQRQRRQQLRPVEPEHRRLRLVELDHRLVELVETHVGGRREEVGQRVGLNPTRRANASIRSSASG